MTEAELSQAFDKWWKQPENRVFDSEEDQAFAAWVDAANMEHARIREHLGRTYTAAEVDALIGPDERKRHTDECVSWLGRVCDCGYFSA